MINKINKINKKILIMIIMCLLSNILFSCKAIKITNSQPASIKDYTKPQVMILVAEEKNKYEKKFGKDVWQLKSGDGSRFFSDLVLQNVKQYVEKMMTINQMSKAYNISIPEKDLGIIDKMSDEYYDNLTSLDKEYIACTIDDVKSMYKELHLARLMIDHITKNANIELSISEAKVARVQYIVLNTREEAESIATRSQARGASFTYFAKQYTENKDEIERIVMRGDDFSRPFPEIYYLATGQVSKVLENNGQFYVFKCLNDYLVEETSKRKKDILKQIKEDSFYEEYNIYEKNNKIISGNKYWEEIDFRKGDESTVSNFNEIYYKYFPITTNG